jgi:hypothetical protein
MAELANSAALFEPSERQQKSGPEAAFAKQRSAQSISR